MGGLIYRPELPPSATPPVSKWEFTVHEGNNIVGAGMSCVMFRANDVVSWSQDGQDLVGWYRLDNIKTTQLTVSWRQQNRVVYGWGNVVAWNSEEWHTNSETPHQPILRLTYWLVKVNVTADPADFDILQKMPLGYLDPYNTSESTAAIQKINFQTVQKPSGGNTLRVQYSSTPQQGDFVVIWQIGRHDFDMSTGKGTAVDTVSDYIFPQAKDAAGGLWYRALTMVGPRTDRMVLHFYYPTATDDLVEQIITQIQSRYKLAPLPADSDSDTSSSDSEMDCYDGFEKLQVYENVRQAGLNHAVSENLALAAVKKKLRRGHAE